MKGLELLNALIERYEETLDIAEAQILNNITWTGNAGNPHKGWCRTKTNTEKWLKLFKALREGFDADLKEAKVNAVKVTNFQLPNAYSGVENQTTRLCWSNYRCVLLLNTDTHLIDPFFWTPELGIANSHHSLVRYAENNYRDDKGGPIHDISYMWGGFYTYGLGNGDQKQLTLYGESSDYRHNEYSEEVKNCFLNGEQYFPSINHNEDFPF